MQVQNVSFKGYQNVVATNTRFINADVSMFSVKLNNKNYVNDLDKWKALQKKLFPNTEPKDIFTYMHIKDHDGEGFNLFLNDRLLAPTKGVFLISKEEEKPMILTFDLLRSIAERILNGEKSEWNFDEVVNEMAPYNAEIIRKIIPEPSVVGQFLASAVFPKEDKNKVVAQVFNESIEDYMDYYVDHLERTGM